ncbi:TPA: hypothetical protein H1940_004731 [Salmonella enterica]|nr:hypothetical protein [Salmonella enterica]
MSFAEKLRQAAKALASGDKKEIVIPAGYIATELAGMKSGDNPSSYVRTTMTRVPEVKAIGTVKIKKSTCMDDDSDLFGVEVFTITLSSERRKTVYSKADVERIKRRAVAKTAERFMMLSPNLANYAPEEYATIAKVMQELNAMVKSQFIDNEDE